MRTNKKIPVCHSKPGFSTVLPTVERSNQFLDDLREIASLSDINKVNKR